MEQASISGETQIDIKDATMYSQREHAVINPKHIWDFPVVIEAEGLNRRHFRVTSQRFLHRQAEAGLGSAGRASVLNLPASLSINHSIRSK